MSSSSISSDVTVYLVGLSTTNILFYPLLDFFGTSFTSSLRVFSSIFNSKTGAK
jgi:hypothetical protein